MKTFVSILNFAWNLKREPEIFFASKGMMTHNNNNPQYAQLLNKLSYCMMSRCDPSQMVDFVFQNETQKIVKYDTWFIADGFFKKKKGQSLGNVKACFVLMLICSVCDLKEQKKRTANYMVLEFSMPQLFIP